MKVVSRSVSEPMAIKAFADQWDDDLHAGDIAWTRNRLELGARTGGLYVGYIQRYDYALRFNDETADLYYREENDLAQPQGDVPVRLHAWHTRSQGVKFAWLQQFSGFYVQPALSLLNGWEFQEGSLSGFLRNENDTLTGSADLEYRYSQDLLLDHRFDKPKGQGVAVDLLFGWQNDQQGWWVEIQDLYGRMVWKEAPYTVGAFNTVDRGSSGEVWLEPAFAGRRGTEDYTQKLDAYLQGSYWLDRNDWRWALDLEYFQSRLWARPGVSWEKGAVVPYLGYEVRDGQWLLGVSDRARQFTFQLGSDTWQLESARSLTLQLGANYRW